MNIRPNRTVRSEICAKLPVGTVWHVSWLLFHGNTIWNIKKSQFTILLSKFGLYQMCCTFKRKKNLLLGGNNECDYKTLCPKKIQLCTMFGACRWKWKRTINKIHPNITLNLFFSQCFFITCFFFWIGHSRAGALQDHHYSLLQGSYGLYPHVWYYQWGVVRCCTGLVSHFLNKDLLLSETWRCNVSRVTVQCLRF